MSSDESPEGKKAQQLRAAVQDSRDAKPAADFDALMGLMESMQTTLAGVARMQPKQEKEKVAALQAFLASCSEASKLAQDHLEQLLVAQPKVSRAGYLKALGEIIPRPPEAEVQAWRSGWEALILEHIAVIKKRELPTEEDRERAIEHKSIPFEVFAEKNKDIFLKRMRHGASLDDAAVLGAAYKGHGAMAKALREGSARHAAIMHRFTDAIANMARWQQEHGEPPPVLYLNLTGQGGLVKHDPAWHRVLEPDATGFRGVLSTASIAAPSATQDTLTEEGITLLMSGKGRVTVDSDVVAFEPLPIDASGDMHAPAMLSTEGVFPPNTLFAVKHVTDKKEFTLDDGRTVKQRLITVTATYRLSSSAESGKSEAKMCATPFTLSYAGREAFVNGLDDITAKPLLTMYQEFARDHSWTDWKGVTYNLRGEMDYVRGAAVKREGCTPGTRDENNHGMTPEDFLKKINKQIDKRRQAGHTGGLPEDHAHLTIEEVLGIRLYSGPAYQPLNEFLRQISNLTGSFRDRVAKLPGLTFAATVGHIIRGIRKLAAVVTPEEASKPLWRGVRGVLPEKFWVKDAAGLVCATDIALMSTSRNQHTPVHYMGEGQNVLWKLSPGVQTDSGFHYGADISPLSQFAGEDEVLFPPYTMLRVEACPDDADGPRKGLKVSQHEAEDGKKKYLQISVLPQFV